jgi:hypothetical protein
LLSGSALPRQTRIRHVHFNEFVTPPAKPLDEAVWRAWVTKGEPKDSQASAARIKAVQWLSLAAILAAAGLWSHLAPYDIAVRFVLTSGAVILMFQAFQSRRFATAVVFGVLALLYNPVSPAFSFSGGWHRAVVAASAVPFVVSLAWGKSGVPHK